MNLSDEEMSTIYLVERCGVAGEPYRKEIERIVSWLKMKIKDDFSKTESTCLIYKVPSSLTELISFIGRLNINVVSYMSDDEDYGEGECTVSGGSRLNVDGKIDFIDMEIICNFDRNGRLNSRSFLNSFYHEINHAYDAYINLNRNSGLDRYFSSGLKGKPRFNNSIINLIFYRLFSETEQNALVASVFGDLDGMNSRRTDYNRDFYRTQFFKIYNEIRNNYKEAINSLSDDECAEIYEYMVKHNIYLDIRFEKTVKSFKKALISKVENKLSKAFSHANKTAIYYYKTKGKDKPVVEMII